MARRKLVREPPEVEEAAESFEEMEGKEDPVVAFMPGVEVDTRLFKGKVSSPAVDLKWVAENMFDRRVKAKDAPSATAWGLLMTCRKSPTMYDNFWNSMYPKMLPTKAQFEADASRREDDGSSIVELCRRFKAAMGMQKEDEI